MRRCRPPAAQAGSGAIQPPAAASSSASKSDRNSMASGGTPSERRDARHSCPPPACRRSECRKNPRTAASDRLRRTWPNSRRCASTEPEEYTASRTPAACQRRRAGATSGYSSATQRARPIAVAPDQPLHRLQRRRPWRRRPSSPAARRSGRGRAPSRSHRGQRGRHLRLVRDALPTKPAAGRGRTGTARRARRRSAWWCPRCRSGRAAGAFRHAAQPAGKRSLIVSPV